MSNCAVWVLLAAAQSPSRAERFAERPDLAFAYVMAILILVALGVKSIMGAGKKTPPNTAAAPSVPAPAKGRSRGAKIAFGCLGVWFLLMVIGIIAGR